jgi:hypothetical protein
LETASEGAAMPPTMLWKIDDDEWLDDNFHDVACVWCGPPYGAIVALASKQVDM